MTSVLLHYVIPGAVKFTPANDGRATGEYARRIEPLWLLRRLKPRTVVFHDQHAIKLVGVARTCYANPWYKLRLPVDRSPTFKGTHIYISTMRAVLPHYRVLIARTEIYPRAIREGSINKVRVNLIRQEQLIIAVPAIGTSITSRRCIRIYGIVHDTHNSSEDARTMYSGIRDVYQSLGSRYNCFVMTNDVVTSIWLRGA